MSRASAARRMTLVALWTVGLALVLYGADRFLLGPSVEGWQVAAELGDVPAGAGVPATPAYVPEGMGWPPEPVLYRVEPGPGWWYALQGGPGPPDVWIGTGPAPAPGALGSAAACVGDADTAPCPRPWRQLSAGIEGTVVYVIGRLEPGELRRILESLHPEHE